MVSPGDLTARTDDETRPHPLSDAESFTVLINSRDDAVPLSFGGAILTMIGDSFPAATVTDPPPGIPLAVRITWEDLHNWTERSADLDEPEEPHTRAICQALDLPYRTWDVALTDVRTRSEAWLALVTRMSKVDPAWLAAWRHGNTTP